MKVRYFFINRTLYRWEECSKHPTGRCKCALDQRAIASDLSAVQMLELIKSAVEVLAVQAAGEAADRVDQS